MSPYKKHLHVFREELEELLHELEQSLIDLEGQPEDMELVDELFRILHTIKGASSMFGADEISDSAHQLEELYEKVRRGAISVTQELIDMSLSSRDDIHAMAQNLECCEPKDSGRIDGPSHTLQSPISALQGSGDPGEGFSGLDNEGNKAIVEGGSETFRIYFKPPANIYRRGLDPASILGELEILGRCTVNALHDNIPPLGSIRPDECYMAWEIILKTDQPERAIDDTFLFVRDDADVRIEKFAQGVPRADKAGIRKGFVFEDASHRTVRVPVEKLDSLVNIVGELVTVEASLMQFMHEWEDFNMFSNSSDGVYIKPELAKRLFNISERMQRMIEELRDRTMDIRMVPIGVIFNRFSRLVRDLSQSLDRDIRLVTEGAETELDKTVIERLGDPLSQLIRNSIYHGIEAPDVRLAAGKRSMGTVTLSAEHAGHYVLIRVSDDGAGLDIERIRRRASERGLISPGDSLTDSEIASLILTPGYSTVREADDCTRHDVGMNAVKKMVSALGGYIRIDNSPGQGVEFTLSLPLTMAIIDGLVVDVGASKFIFPLVVIEECVELTEQDMKMTHGRNLIHVRNETIPFVVLRDVFCISESAPDIQQIVIVNIEGAKVGFVVDSVVGQTQTVIKPLGGPYKSIENISGASILGDGSIALILDASKLISSVEADEAA